MLMYRSLCDESESLISGSQDILGRPLSTIKKPATWEDSGEDSAKRALRYPWWLHLYYNRPRACISRACVSWDTLHSRASHRRASHEHVSHGRVPRRLHLMGVYLMACISRACI